MTRTLKVFGLVLLAVAALGATVAKAEKTSSALFTAAVSASETAKGVGEQIGTSEFKIGALPPMTCATAKGSGKALSKGPSSEKVTIEAFGETCHVVIAGVTKPITITANGCAGVFTATTTETGGVKTFTVNQETECPAGKAVVVHVYNNAAHTESLCTYEVPPQNLGNEGELVNNTGASPDDVIARGTIKGIKVKRVSGSALVCGPAESTAVATGEITIQATNEKGEFVNATVSG